MLPSQNRLTKKKDFDLVFTGSKSVKSGFLICKAAKNTLQVSRFGFVVSKKISNKAVVRNKVRRRLQKAVENNLGNIKKPLDVVVVSLSGIEKKEFVEIEQTLVVAFKKLGLL